MDEAPQKNGFVSEALQSCMVLNTLKIYKTETKIIYTYHSTLKLFYTWSHSILEVISLYLSFYFKTAKHNLVDWNCFEFAVKPHW